MRIPSRPALLAVVSTASLAAAGLHTLSTGVAGSTTGGQFTVQCAYSHTLKDDSIVFPQRPGASHAHDFYGNVSADAFSIYPAMLLAGTTCTTPDDTAAYWQPSLLVDGVPVASNAERAYYQNVTKGPIHAFPPGLRVIAGNSRATGPQPTSVFYWGCAHDENAGQLTSPPQCSDQLRAHIIFPNCWDGVNLDSPDHKAHMAYSTSGSCPADHPVALPRLIIAVGWNATPAPASVSLSSGSAYTMHADFFNSWKQSALESLVTRCLAAHLNCGEITAPQTGSGGSPVPAPRTPAPTPALAPVTVRPATVDAPPAPAPVAAGVTPPGGISTPDGISPSGCGAAPVSPARSTLAHPSCA